MNLPCKICGSKTIEHAKAQVRGKYVARFLKCDLCGFMFVEDPHWLAEAYAEPINRSDTGYVSRNLWARDKVCSLIEASQVDPDGTFLDYAAGYGMFVRLMRDSGYDFRWDDPYCQNLFSRGFEATTPLTGQFEIVTAFEVLEHLPNPLEEIKKIASITQVFVFSTALVPEPVPQPNDWWYYGLEHGQHIAFYTRKSLESLASQLGYSLVTTGMDFHVLSSKPISLENPSEKYIPRWQFWVKREAAEKIKRQSLTQSDHAAIVKHILQTGK